MDIWNFTPRILGWREKNAAEKAAAKAARLAKAAARVTPKGPGLLALAKTASLFVAGGVVGAAIVTAPWWIPKLKAEYEEKGLQRIADRITGKTVERRGQDEQESRDRQGLAGENAVDGYYVVTVTLPNGGAIYSVKSGEQFYPSRQPRRPLYLSEFRHGGVADAIARLQVDGPHESAVAATEQLGQWIVNRSIRKPSLAGGWVGQDGSKSVTIDDWGLVDFAVLRRMGKFQ